MKKLYTILLSMAVALFSVAPCAGAAVKGKKSRISLSNVSDSRSARHQRAKVISRANEDESFSAQALVGLYDWEYDIDGGYNMAHGDVRVSLGENENEILIDGLWEGCVAKATIDPAEGTISIPNQVIGSDAAGDLYLIRIQYDPFNDVYQFLTAGCSAHVSGEDILFEDDNDFAIVNAKDELLLKSFVAILFRVEDMDPSLWTPLEGKALFEDGWFAPSLEETVSAYEVEVWRNNANQSLYAIVDPYGPGTPMYDENLDEAGKGFIVVDVENPDCVLVRTRQYSGLTASVEYEFDDGEFDFYDSQFYCDNFEQQFYSVLGWTKDEIIENFAEEGMPISTMKGNVIEIHNCVYGDQDDLLETYCFDENSVAKLTLPQSGIDGVVTDDAVAPVEYFNLQGIHVANPAGGLFIRRQGSETTKVLVK